MSAPSAGPVCPNGHASDEPDYCSVCGAPVPGAGAPAPELPGTPPSPPPSPAGAEACPSCGTARSDPSARFCEVCRYDFEARAPGPPPVAKADAAEAGAAAAPGQGAVVAPTGAPAAAEAPVAGSGAGEAAGAAPPGAEAAPSRPVPAPGPAGVEGPAEWEVLIVVDPALDREPDPAQPPPSDVGERLFPIDLSEMLVGRRDDRLGIRPEIPIFDPGVSRRHANFLRLPAGGLAILDLASANGTAVNGIEVAPGERHELSDGDTVTLGRWTRITVRRRSGSGR